MYIKMVHTKYVDMCQYTHNTEVAMPSYNAKSAEFSLLHPYAGLLWDIQTALNER
jgi:hypothetical protein